MCPYDNRTFLSLSHRDYDSERYLVDSKSSTSSLTFNTVLKTQSATTVVRKLCPVTIYQKMNAFELSEIF